MEKFELGLVQQALDRLEASHFKGILVGGHAVNFWAHHYRQSSPEWNSLLPYTSEDLDFLGGRNEALLCQQLFGGTATINDGTDPSPQAGVILAPLAGRIIRFDIITSIIGVESFDVTQNALLPGEGSQKIGSIRVLHPLHCLIGKTAGLAQLPQAGRQDLKHLKLSILIVHAFISERLDQVRPVLKMIERVFALAQDELGLRVWHRHGVEIKKALPLDVIRGQTDERLSKFVEIRLPQVVAQLTEERRRYIASFSKP